MISLNVEENSKISDFITQFGDFTSYNKCILPTNLTIKLGTQGTYDKLSNMVFLLTQYKNSTQLVNIHTSFNVFIGYNITQLSYSIEADRNMGYLECEIKARQVYISDQQFSAYANIEEAPLQSLGKIATLDTAIEIFDTAKALTHMPMLEWLYLCLG